MMHSAWDLTDVEDEDGIDGPFERAMAAAMREDRRAACSSARRRLETIEALTLAWIAPAPKEEGDV